MLETGIGERHDALLQQLVEVCVPTQHVGAQKRSERILAADVQACKFRIDARPIVLDGYQRLIDCWQVEPCDHSADATPATRSALWETPFVDFTDRETCRHTEPHGGDSGFLASSNVTLADFDQIAVRIPHVAANLSRVMLWLGEKFHVAAAQRRERVEAALLGT